MNNIKLYFISTLALVLISMTTALAADIDTGRRAYKDGDYETALNNLSPLAQDRNRIAQLYLGTMYLFGQGVQQDYGKAVLWFRRASDQGLAEAQYNLGKLYKDGVGVSQDYVEAAKWYTYAALQGDVRAQNSLGLLYKDGLGVQKDHVEAAKWFQRAADKGDAIAQHNLEQLNNEK